MGIVVKGMEEVLASLAKVGEKHAAAVAAAVYQEASIVGRASLKECPVDTGRLRASYYLKPPTDVWKPVATMGYGTDYALYVHENTAMPHKPPTKAKFLEDPINAAKTGWAERVAARAEKNAASGVGLGGLSGESGEGGE